MTRKSRTGSTMDIVPHLVISIPVPGQVRKIHIRPKADSLIDDPTRVTVKGPVNRTNQSIPMFALVGDKVYRFGTIDQTLAFVRKGMGGFLKRALREQGWHLFSDGTCIWRVGIDTPECVKAFVKEGVNAD